ncbi:MAG: hypothetical protein CBD16_05685 [Betaproteobacteria bacterium TMED156]|nr:MAG: hypothetical protein CBD16_05685 [Betaproteobacteria bacterium TMED156]|tara:strand:- start:203 stop:574 length:372 start_codon:yes stop_codon:yes gene_type:complete
MSKAVCTTSLLGCSCGSSPSPLMVLPVNGVSTSYLPAANALDHLPFLNILPFGNCTTTSNPMVSAAGGSPVPCIPMTFQPWSNTATKVTIKGQPSVIDSSQVKCLWGGNITVQLATQQIVDKT